MELSLYEAKTYFSKVVQDLIDGKEDIYIVKKNGKAVVQITLLNKKLNKRVGVAKKEMGDFDISLEELNELKVDEFDL